MRPCEKTLPDLPLAVKVLFHSFCCYERDELIHNLNLSVGYLGRPNQYNSHTIGGLV